MKKKAILLLIVGAVFTGAALFIFLKDNRSPLYDAGYTWYTDYGSNSGDLLIRGRKIADIKNDVHKLTAALNGSDKDPESFQTPEEREPNDPPKIKLIKVENNVAHVEIINADYLTQRMGTSGARDYLASATYTFTENPHIKKVHFIFDEGDHAIPGVYSRESFANYYTIVDKDSRRQK